MATVIAQGPGKHITYERFITDGGAEFSDDTANATGLIWHDYHGPEELKKCLKANPQLLWVQLPFAGVDNFAELFEWISENRPELKVTSAKGAYREPVAEHALMLALALGRAIPARVRAGTWGGKFAVSMFDAEVLIYGGGGITEELVRLLTPFRAKITVLRRSPEPMNGVGQVLPSNELLGRLPFADFVFVTAALTDETRGVFDSTAFKAMKSSAFLINIARGGHVVTEDLIGALFAGAIGGAGVDVTDPEPLPDSSQLWKTPNTIITPHTADTPEMIQRLFGERIRVNVEAFSEGKPLVGTVDLRIGY
jgi:phosphoglycerate dehydrogenase-like enzyme